MSEPLATSADRPLAARSPVRDWLRRYGPAELAGVAAALLGSWLVHAWTGSEIAAAFGGSLGENVGFYGVIIGREIRADRHARVTIGRRYGIREWRGTALNLVVEFGAAELLDSCLLRPLAMGVGTSILGRELGVIAGKIVADITFYAPVILAYEMRRRTSRSTN